MEVSYGDLTLPDLESHLECPSWDFDGEGNKSRLVGCGVRSPNSMGTSCVPRNLCGDAWMAF